MHVHCSPYFPLLMVLRKFEGNFFSAHSRSSPCVICMLIVPGQWGSVVAHMLIRQTCKVEWVKRLGSAFGKRSHSDFSFPHSSEYLQWSNVDVGCCGLANLASVSTVACPSLWVSYFYNFVSEASGIVFFIPAGDFKQVCQQCGNFIPANSSTGLQTSNTKLFFLPSNPPNLPNHTKPQILKRTLSVGRQSYSSVVTKSIMIHTLFPDSPIWSSWKCCFFGAHPQ